VIGLATEIREWCSESGTLSRFSSVLHLTGQEDGMKAFTNALCLSGLKSTGKAAINRLISSEMVGPGLTSDA
jgi:hypothetical protein